MKALAERAVACKKWRWMEGMLILTGDKFTPRIRIIDDLGASAWMAHARATDLPDLSDPATLGCLLALVREVYREPALFTNPQFDGSWAINIPDYYDGEGLKDSGEFGSKAPGEWLEARSEAEIMVKALEVAP